jgi:hypothetical protein
MQIANFCIFINILHHTVCLAVAVLAAGNIGERGISTKLTTSQLLHVLQDIHQALESRNQVDAVYLDFAKAFDKVVISFCWLNFTSLE